MQHRGLVKDSHSDGTSYLYDGRDVEALSELEIQYIALLLRGMIANQTAYSSKKLENRDQIKQ